MTLSEAKQIVDAAIEREFASQQDARLTDYVTVRIDDDLSGAFEAFIHAPNAADHLRARMVIENALAGYRVTFPQVRT